MKAKKIFAMVLIVISLFSIMAFPSSAAYSVYGDPYDYQTGILWLKTVYSIKVERDSNWFGVFYGNEKVSTGFDYKNKVGVVLSQTRNFEISKQTKKSLNAGVDFSGYGVPAKVGGSIEKTKSYKCGVSNTSTRTIPDSAPCGYYSYNVCINLYKIRLTKTVKGQANGPSSSIEFFVARSEPYRSIVYNPNDASYSGVSQY